MTLGSSRGMKSGPSHCHRTSASLRGWIPARPLSLDGPVTSLCHIPSSVKWKGCRAPQRSCSTKQDAWVAGHACAAAFSLSLYPAFPSTPAPASPDGPSEASDHSGAAPHSGRGTRRLSAAGLH